MPSEKPIPTAPFPEPAPRGVLKDLAEERPPHEPRFHTLDIAFGIPIAILFDVIALLEITDPFLGIIEFLYYKKKGFKNSVAGLNTILAVVIKLIPILNWFPWYLISFIVMIFIDRSPQSEKYLDIIGKVAPKKPGIGTVASSGPAAPVITGTKSEHIIDATKEKAMAKEGETIIDASGRFSEEGASSASARGGRGSASTLTRRGPREAPATSEENEEDLAEESEEEQSKNLGLEERMNTGTAELHRVENLSELKKKFEEVEPKTEEEEEDEGETIDTRKAA